MPVKNKNNMKKEKQGKEMYFANRILLALEDIIINEDSEFYIGIKELEEEGGLTNFIHAMSNIAPATLYSKLTNDDKNILEFNHLANQLVFQYAEKGE